MGIMLEILACDVSRLAGFSVEKHGFLAGGTACVQGAGSLTRPDE